MQSTSLDVEKSEAAANTVSSLVFANSLITYLLLTLNLSSTHLAANTFAPVLFASSRLHRFTTLFSWNLLISAMRPSRKDSADRSKTMPPSP